MALYEHVFMARQDISQAQMEALMKEYADLIGTGGGKVTKTEYWGVKNLAYKIKKSRKAHYALFNLDAPPAAVKEMERLMGISTDVLRFMTIKVEEHETEPSAQMRKQDREERSERGGGFGGGGGRGGFGGGGGRGGFGGGGGRGGPGGGGGGFRGGGDRGGDRPPRPAGDRPQGDRPADRGTFRPRPAGGSDDNSGSGE
jgi:small subunit ribosomal protein S6